MLVEACRGRRGLGRAHHVGPVPRGRRAEALSAGLRAQALEVARSRPPTACCAPGVHALLKELVGRSMRRPRAGSPADPRGGGEPALGSRRTGRSHRCFVVGAVVAAIAGEQQGAGLGAHANTGRVQRRGEGDAACSASRAGGGPQPGHAAVRRLVWLASSSVSVGAGRGGHEGCRPRRGWRTRWSRRARHQCGLHGCARGRKAALPVPTSRFANLSMFAAEQHRASSGATTWAL